MTTTTNLLRAPRDCAAWVWWPDPDLRGLADQYALAARITAITDRLDLMRPNLVTSEWVLDGRIVPQAGSSIEGDGALDSPEFAAALASSRPKALPEAAVPGKAEITGPGRWIDAAGGTRAENGLLRLTVDLVGPMSSVGLEVFHDIWMPYDFTGKPHPEVYRYNAPRLARALADISALMGSEAEPDEPTYFGAAVADGVENSTDDDGEPLDVTDLM